MFNVSPRNPSEENADLFAESLLPAELLVILLGGKVRNVFDSEVKMVVNVAVTKCGMTHFGPVSDLILGLRQRML